MKVNIMNITIETTENDFLTDNEKIDIMNYIKEAYNNRKHIASKAKDKASTIGFDSNKITNHLLDIYGNNKAIQAYIKSFIFKVLGYAIESRKQFLLYKTYVIAKINHPRNLKDYDIKTITNIKTQIDEIEGLKNIDKLKLKNHLSLLYIHYVFEGFEYSISPEFYQTKNKAIQAYIKGV
tara:strand:- start:249 stop:788 length:540 start_codon:yes stop_codon:yes gene_type:complete